MKKNMYELLSEKTDNEIVSRVAYTYYKAQKVEYINSLNEEIIKSDAKLATALNSFYDTAYLETSINSYIRQGEDFEKDFADEINEIVSETYDKKIDELEKETNEMRTLYLAEIEGIKKAYKEDITKIVKDNTKPLHSILQSMAASLLFFLFSGLFIFFVWLKDVPMEKIFNGFITGQPANQVHDEANNQNKPEDNKTNN